MTEKTEETQEPQSEPGSSMFSPYSLFLALFNTLPPGSPEMRDAEERFCDYLFDQLPPDKQNKILEERRFAQLPPEEQREERRRQRLASLSPEERKEEIEQRRRWLASGLHIPPEDTPRSIKRLSDDTDDDSPSRDTPSQINIFAPRPDPTRILPLDLIRWPKISM